MKNKSRARKQRRQVKAVMKYGTAAKPKHNLKSGRTGGVHKKKLSAARCKKEPKNENG